MRSKKGGGRSDETALCIDIKIYGKKIHPATTILIIGTIMWLPHLFLNDTESESEKIAVMQKAMSPLFSEIARLSEQVNLNTSSQLVVCRDPGEVIKAEIIAAQGDTDIPVLEFEFDPSKVIIQDPESEDNLSNDLEVPNEPEEDYGPKENEEVYEPTELNEPELSDETVNTESEIINDSVEVKPEVSDGNSSIIDSNSITPVIPDYDTSQGLAEVSINFSQRHTKGK